MAPDTAATRAIAIKAGEPPVEVYLSTPPKLDEIQALVGGYIESVPTTVGETMYLNEEGKISDGPIIVNCLATAITRGIVADHDLIVGDVVLLGPPDDEGNDTSATITLEQLMAVPL